MLKRLEIAGFKSFARKTALDFSTATTAVVGPNGSGKCVTGDTFVQLASGGRVPIQTLFDRASASARKTELYDDGVAILESGEQVDVLALNLESLKIEARPVQAFVRRTAPETLLTVTTRSGRSVTATPYHPLFTLINGNVEATRADLLAPGLRIAVPRALPIRGAHQPLSMFAVLAAFQKEDAVYIPYSKTLALRIRAHSKSATRVAQDAGLASETVQRFFDGQSLPFSAALQLFIGEDEAEIFPDRLLKSRTWGFIRVPELIDEEVARFLGYLIAEGRNCKNGQIRFVNDDMSLVEDFVACAMERFGVSTTLRSYKGRGIVDAFISSKTLSRLLDRTFGITQDGHSRTKVVPPQVFASPDSVVSAFLSALFEGDGHFHTSRPSSRADYVEYASASKQLADDVATLLLRFGIVAVVRRKEKRATNGTGPKRPYWSVFIYGSLQLSLLAKILTLRGRKRLQLATFAKVQNVSNPNLDLVPGAALLVRNATKAAQVPIKRVRKEYPTLAAYCEGRCEASRPGIVRCIEAIERYGKKTEESYELTQKLRVLVGADTLWDEIVSVTKRTGEKYVYDLCVADDHNFIANNVVVHNSNIAEAFRFALGEQSMKSMRGKRSEDLIFAGSQNTARQNRAAVTIIFDNTKRIFPRLDFDEVSVERVVFRDGASEYSINGSRVRLRDVQELLASANIGETGHHIISQGEADRILLAHPRERRAMLEDALGLKVFEFKKQEALRKLEKTRENVKEVESLRRELAPHLKFLEKQVQKLERVEELARELVESAKEYFAVEDIYLETENTKNTQATHDARERLAVAEKELGLFEEETTAESEGMKRVEAVRVAEREVDRATAERSELARDVGRIEGALGEAKRRSAALAREPYVKVPREHIEALRSEVDTQTTFDHNAEPAQLIGALKALRMAITAFFERFALPSDDYLAEEEQAVYKLEAEKEKLSERERMLSQRVEEGKNVLEQARLARLAYDETGRESKVRILELAETRAREEGALAREEARTKELAYLQEELVRDRTEVLALAGSAAFSYEPLLEAPQEERRAQEDRKRAMERLKIRIEEAGGTGEEVRTEYTQTKEREEFLARELGDLASSATGLEGLINDLDEELAKSFAEGLAKVNQSFAEFFTLMFGGGGAKLVLEDIVLVRTTDHDEDEEEEDETVEDKPERRERPGLEINVHLPKKRLQSLMQLSGGERALTSIALIFAMSQVNPPPFLILDETDAALDEANSRRYGDMIEALSKKSQLIVITHNRETMSRAGILYGVTMGGDAISKLLSVKFEEAVVVAK